jgi:hypothetical protein
LRHRIGRISPCQSYMSRRPSQSSSRQHLRADAYTGP